MIRLLSDEDRGGLILLFSDEDREGSDITFDSLPGDFFAQALRPSFVATAKTMHITAETLHN